MVNLLFIGAQTGKKYINRNENFTKIMILIV
jgi:hypothetical protein